MTTRSMPHPGATTRLRSLSGLAIALMVIGCSAPAAEPSESRPVAASTALATFTPSPTPVATPPPTPVGTTPAHSPTPSVAGHGSVTYVITGDYSATGELPFVPSSSSFDQDGATSLVFCSGPCTYQDSSAFLVMSLGTGEVSFENGQVQFQVACTFTFTGTNEIGAAGEFACIPYQAFGPGDGGVCGWTDRLDGTLVISRTDTCSPIGIASIRGSFDAGGS